MIFDANFQKEHYLSLQALYRTYNETWKGFEITVLQKVILREAIHQHIIFKPCKFNVNLWIFLKVSYKKYSNLCKRFILQWISGMIWSMTSNTTTSSSLRAWSSPTNQHQSGDMSEVTRVRWCQSGDIISQVTFFKLLFSAFSFLLSRCIIITIIIIIIIIILWPWTE